MAEDDFSTLNTGIGQGLLGAVVWGEHGADLIREERLQMIERHILRLEAALRVMGFDPYQLPLPETKP